jgi:PAS domain S-box-containing protein
MQDTYYRVEKDFGIQLYIHDDKKNMVTELDETGNILYISEYTLSVTGYAAEEVSGRSWFEIFIPDHEKERISKVHQSVIEDDSQAWNCTNMIICKDGSLINVDWNNFLIKKTDGAVEKVFALGVVK